MKNIYLVVFLILSNYAFSQCNYTTLNQNGVSVRQFNPMPIGGDSQMQVALSISNVNGEDNLLVTIRFKGYRKEMSKKIKISIFDGKIVNLVAQRVGEDSVGGSNLTHLIFSLSEITKNALMNSKIKSLTLNNQDIISAKMFENYISSNLKCFN